MRVQDLLGFQRGLTPGPGTRHGAGDDEVVNGVGTGPTGWGWMVGDISC